MKVQCRRIGRISDRCGNSIMIKGYLIAASKTSIAKHYSSHGLFARTVGMEG